jgi:hypothetical protein
LNQVIAGLKPKQRVALLLHRIDGLNYVEIAREIGISASGARLLVETERQSRPRGLAPFSGEKLVPWYCRPGALAAAVN